MESSICWDTLNRVKPDSKIKTINGFINISSIKRLEGEIEVYNFEVEKFHAYLVGLTGLVVHNKCSENNRYLVAWRKHKAEGGTALGFSMDGDATDQEFLDFIGSVEGQQYLNEYGGTVQGINGVLFSWSVGRGVVSALGWLSKQLGGKGNLIEISEQYVNHIFRDSKGHFPVDTQYNRRMLIETASNKKNYLGLDQFGNKWYSRTTQEGNQIWAQVRDNKIRYGGINETPKVWNPKTGLSSPFKPNQK